MNITLVLNIKLWKKKAKTFFQEIESIVPSFNKTSEKEKVTFMFTFNEYDGTKLIVKRFNGLYVLKK